MCVFSSVCVCCCFCQMTNVQFENVKEFFADMLFENLLRLALHCQFTSAGRHCHAPAHAPILPPPYAIHGTCNGDICCAREPKRSSLLIGRRGCCPCCVPCYCCLVIAAIANSLSFHSPPFTPALPRLEGDCQPEWHVRSRIY